MQHRTEQSKLGRDQPHHGSGCAATSYYYFLKLWLKLGKATYWVRHFSACWGVLVVPMIYATGQRWARSETVGLWAAAYLALAPFPIYYSQMTRVYSQGVAACLGTAYFALRAADAGRLGTEDPGNRARFRLSGAIALHTFYYSALALVAVFIYLVASARRTMRAVVISFSLLAVLCLPWMIYSLSALIAQVGGHTGSQWAWTDTLGFWREGLYGLDLPMERTGRWSGLLWPCWPWGPWGPCCPSCVVGGPRS